MNHFRLSSSSSGARSQTHSHPWILERVAKIRPFFKKRFACYAKKSPLLGAGTFVKEKKVKCWRMSPSRSSPSSVEGRGEKCEIDDAPFPFSRPTLTPFPPSPYGRRGGRWAHRSLSPSSTIRCTAILRRRRKRALLLLVGRMKRWGGGV